MNIRQSIATLVLGLCAAGAAMAQQVTRIVVPFPAGGGTDQYVRLLAADLTKRGMQVIVETSPAPAASWRPTMWHARAPTAPRC